MAVSEILSSVQLFHLVEGIVPSFLYASKGASADFKINNQSKHKQPN